YATATLVGQGRGSSLALVAAHLARCYPARVQFLIREVPLLVGQAGVGGKGQWAPPPGQAGGLFGRPSEAWAGRAEAAAAWLHLRPGGRCRWRREAMRRFAV